MSPVTLFTLECEYELFGKFIQMQLYGPYLWEFDRLGLELGPVISNELLGDSDAGLPRSTTLEILLSCYLLICRIKIAASIFCN